MFSPPLQLDIKKDFCYKLLGRLTGAPTELFVKLFIQFFVSKAPFVGLGRFLFDFYFVCDIIFKHKKIQPLVSFVFPEQAQTNESKLVERVIFQPKPWNIFLYTKKPLRRCKWFFYA